MLLAVKTSVDDRNASDAVVIDMVGQTAYYRDNEGYIRFLDIPQNTHDFVALFCFGEYGQKVDLPDLADKALGAGKVHLAERYDKIHEFFVNFVEH